MHAPADTPMLEVENLNLSFPVRLYGGATIKDFFIQSIKSPWSLFQNTFDNHILKNINFKIKKNDVVALVGVNGSGKTSLCRCIAGLLTAKEGKITKNCQIRSVIQTEAGFYPELTGRENAKLMSYFIYQDLSKNDRENLVKEALAFSGLGPLIDAPIETYSMGMKSRLSLALTTALPQELLILDEVYSHADEFFQDKIRNRLEAQIKSSGAVIMVSHYEKDFINLCNRGIVLHEGEIKYDGNLTTALEAYRFMNGPNRDNCHER
jgi:ABC-type polysaccharide/polyol phosphate transport system ATPase subunit